MDIRHFVILECRHLANGCVLKRGCIGLMLFRNLSCLGTIICYINTIGIVPAYACNVTVWLQVMHPLANVHETKWTPHVKRASDVAVHIIAVTKGNGFWYMYSRRGEHVILWRDLFSRSSNVEMRSM